MGKNWEKIEKIGKNWENWEKIGGVSFSGQTKLAEKVRLFTENHTHKMCHLHVGSFWVKTKINITWEMGLGAVKLDFHKNENARKLENMKM